MANYKGVDYAEVPSGLVSNFYLRIYLDNGLYYDRYYSFNYNQKELMKSFHNILKSKQYAIQYLQYDNERITEVSNAVVRGEFVKKVTIKDFNPIFISLFQEEEDYWGNRYSI